MHLPTLDSFNFTDKVVLLRTDFNVPLEGTKITDISRIQATLPTIKELLAKKAKIIILSHLGRPAGKKDSLFSLQPIAAELAGLVGTEAKVIFCDETIGPAVEQLVHHLKSGEILFLENLRFYEGEEKNAPDFAAALARLGDIYVNDAFSVSHRAHASVDGLPRLLPHCAGRLFEKEVTILESLLSHPQKPVMAILGGAKVSTKLELIENLIDKMDILAIGGGMANTFLLAQGYAIGKSLAEPSLVPQCITILEKAHQKKCHIILPQDVIVATSPQAAQIETLPLSHPLHPDQMILDIGPATVKAICTQIDHAHTLVWNGPVGLFEITPFDKGTHALARHIATCTSASHLMSVAGGGDTASALQHMNLFDQFTYVSMAGGAFLEWLEGKKLPGVEALRS